MGAAVGEGTRVVAARARRCYAVEPCEAILGCRARERQSDRSAKDACKWVVCWEVGGARWGSH